MIARVLLAAVLISAGTARADEKIHKPVKNEAFGPGERLKFHMKYEFVVAGEATMEVREGPLINGRPSLTLQSNAESNKFIDKFFKVRDFNGSAIDRESLVSLHFHQNLKEGKYQVVRNTSFDYVNKRYTYERISKGKTTTKTGKLEQPVADILSSFFVLRTLDLEPGKDYSIDVFSDNQIYPLKVHVFPGVETISVPAGRFECLKIEPTIIGDAIFKAKEGKMTIWLTNDRHHMPVLIRSKVAVGSFDAELVKHTLK